MRTVPRSTPGAVIVAELVGVSLGCVAASLRAPVIVAVVAGIVVAIACLLPISGRPAIGWLALLAQFPFARERELPVAVAIDDDFGVTWAGLECAAVVSVTPRPALNLLSRRRAIPGRTLPLSALGDALVQHDIRLSGIDVISHSQQIQTRAASVLRQLVGPLPAVPNQSVWIVVRLDARDSSVARRGDGRAGTVAALRTATSRIIHLLAADGICARTLSAREIDAAAAALGGSARTTRWSAIDIDDRDNIGYSDIAMSSFEKALVATTMVSLRPVENCANVDVSYSCRLVGGQAAGRRVDGRQLEHLVAHLPVASPATPTLRYRETSLRDLEPLAAGGCGQLVGATRDGMAVAVSLWGPGTAVASVSGTPPFLRQTIFRSIATGARIVVRSARPEIWQPLLESISNFDELRVIPLDAPPPTGFDVVVVDGDSAGPYPGSTTVYIGEAPTAADVELVQSFDFITVRAGGRTVDVDLVTVPAEQDFIATSRGVRVR